MTLWVILGNSDLLIFKGMYSFSNVANFVCNLVIFLNPKAFPLLFF